MSRYPTTRMYQVTVDFKASGPMDISAKKGDVVGIIKEQDPSGGSDKWYVDNGGEYHKKSRVYRLICVCLYFKVIILVRGGSQLFLTL